MMKQIAQRATIAQLRANFTFSYCKSMGDDDPRGLANLDCPRGMIGRIYVGYHYLLLHTKYQSSLPHGFREEDFFLRFPTVSIREMMTPGAWLI